MWNLIIAMTVTDKLGLLFAVLLFCLFPLAVFGEHPGLTPGGCVQLAAIVATMIGALVMFRKERVVSWLVETIFLILATVISQPG